MNTNQGKGLNKLASALAFLNSIDPERGVYVHHLEVLLFINEFDSVTYKQIEENFNITNASVSRTVCTLSENASHRETSYGFIEKFIDPREGRRYRVRTIKKGKSVIRALEGIMGE